jgi:hypothetical protein
MTIIELIEDIESLDVNFVIFAVKRDGEWLPDSPALIANKHNETESQSRALSLKNDNDSLSYDYFLEVNRIQWGYSLGWKWLCPRWIGNGNKISVCPVQESAIEKAACFLVS